MLRPQITTYESQIQTARTYAQKFDSNGDEKIDTSDEYVDLADIALLFKIIPNASIQNASQALIDAVNAYVIPNTNIAKPGVKLYLSSELNENHVHGVSIFFPKGDFKRSFYNCQNLDFACDTTWFPTGISASINYAIPVGWGPFLVDYIENITPSAPDDPNPPDLMRPLDVNFPIYLPLVLRDFASSANQILTVSKNGTGSGMVTSSPAGINCGSTCSAPFNSNTNVILTAFASTGSNFTGWSGSGCTGTGTCTVTVDANKSVTAAFTLSGSPSANFDAWPTSGTSPLFVEFHIVDTSNMTTCTWNYGDGTAIGTSCSPYHDHTYLNPGIYTVTFTASGPGGSNNLTRTNYITVNTVNPTLTVTKTGTGIGTVTSNPAGINSWRLVRTPSLTTQLSR